MSSPGRPLSGSRSMQASQSPFLNMLNPLSSRTHHGYFQANQSVPEEQDDEDTQERDLEAGGQPSTVLSSLRPGRRRSSAGHEHHALRPNIRVQDAEHEAVDSDDDAVPQDFMVEAASRPNSGTSSKHKRTAKGKERERISKHNSKTSSPRSPSRAGPSSSSSRLPSVSIPPRPSELGDPATEHEQHLSIDAKSSPRAQMGGLDAYERALWNWVNVYNLDAFLQEVYYYYEGKGIYSIALSRGLNLLTVGFVIGFSTFLLGCIDWPSIRPSGHQRLSEVIVDHCVSRFSGWTLLFFLLFTAFYAWQAVAFALGIFRLIDMHNFYTHLLKIPDGDIQTISWPEVVRRISNIRESNPLTALSSEPTPTAAASLDAHDIANRIMRQENYLIALFNKDVLDLRLPLPRALQRLDRGRTLTKALEWNLRFCLMEYLFDQHGRVRKVFLKSKNRKVLIEGLKRRFIFMGILNAIFAPFIIPYLLMYSFFRYFEEYHKNPSSIGSRRYTAFAQWKFREFNELPHIFTRRLDESYPAASQYIGQFPNAQIAVIMRFVAFISGSFAGVLALASVIDPDLFLYFEITPHRTVLFYVTLFTAIMTTARGMVPEDNLVFDPEMLMEEVVHYTHYMPDEWKGHLHAKSTHAQFGELFTLKIVIFAQELISVLLTPLVLWFSLPRCAPTIIDFFRDFTVHVDGRGYVCSFAEFDFHRHGNVKFGAPTKVRDAKMMSKEGKMEKSFLNFKAANPDWNPTDPSGSLYLSRMTDALPTASVRRRQPNMEATTLLADRPGTLQDRAHEYDRALRQSQYAAAVRKRHGGMGASTLAPGSTIFHSTIGGTIGGMAMAQTAILGDSQGSVALQPLPRTTTSDLSPGDRAADGGVDSELGESYVDGAEAKNARLPTYAEEEEEGLEDGGVLGLLAQIYETKGQGPARVI